MNLKEFSKLNLARCESPDGFDHPIDSWIPEQWTNAMAGEVGEACNIAKKIGRLRDGIRGNKENDKDDLELRKRMAKEIADSMIYGDLAIQSLGFDTSEVLAEVFNAKSDEIGSEIKILAPPKTYETVIRNYQGKLPKGTWYCDNCCFETTDKKLAAKHSDHNGTWLWLIPDDVENGDTFEIHPSDSGGVYLNKYMRQVSYLEIAKRRVISSRACQPFRIEINAK